MFACECVRCGGEFTSELPTVFCSDACRARMAAAHEAWMLKYYASPGAIWPGDTVMYRDPRQRPGVPRSDDVR